jgi:acetyl esterase/lipase
MKRQSLLHLFSLTLVALFLTACASSATPSESIPLADTPTLAPAIDTPTSVPPTAQSYEIVQDIPYQKDGSDYAQVRCKLDIYLPEGRENFPVLVWFHGGALKYGSKSEFYATSVARRFASKGIGVVLPNYRLSPRVKYPTYIEDAASAVAWVYHNIATYQGNPEQLFAGGHSSGAYLAAMIGMDERYLEQHQLTSQQIAGVIPLSGQMYGDSTVWAERDIYKTIDETMIDETTPMFYVQRDAPPFLCICADGETLCEENQKFIEALRSTGHQNVTFKEIPDRTHFSIITEMKSSDDPVLKLTLTFIQKAISKE